MLKQGSSKMCEQFLKKLLCKKKITVSGHKHLSLILSEKQYFAIFK